MQVSTSGLRVTSWNILAPVIDASKMFPGIERAITDSVTRRGIIQQHLARMDCDIVLLQEVKPLDLDALLNDGLKPLSHIYEHHIALEKRGNPQENMGHETSSHAVPETDTDEERPRPRISSKGRTIYPADVDLEVGEAESQRGVAILWRRNLLDAVMTLQEQGKDVLNPAAFLRGFIPSLDMEVLFATKHLDALGCPPSAGTSQKQLLGVADAIAELIETSNVASSNADDVAIIFGGDCNVTSRAPAFKTMQERGFLMASGQMWMPTCFQIFASSRVDHIFARGPLEVVDCIIPECPLGHCCAVLPFFHSIQLMADKVESIKKRTELTCWHRFFGCLLIFPLVLVLIFLILIPMPLSFRRCRWALQEWGSDHLPVTVTFTKTLVPCT